ncbi:Pycsar system effector family protein [Streptomyces jumonjinensis]|uniref:Integral membrane plasmid transfer protein n=1 Tax=Streptomyces jumonjinensis TaxID=1945 RepID=A0A646KPC0_STRJU|nr:Pycsar system effector family protein [Streptomyces jumonjinensis]MQT02836.1 integral membrane plasmid transfer protein [Streptomyces jumonjinensis]
MATTIPTVDKNLDAARAAVVAEIARTDSKASLLLAFDGVLIAGLIGLADKSLPTPVKIFGTLAVLALGIAVVLLLLVVRPCLSGADRASFPFWATLDEDQIRARMQTDTRPASIRVLSVIALAKFTRLRRAIDLSLTALALLALAAASTLA